jgi:uncharacterized phage protein (TIGR01671 family)
MNREILFRGKLSHSGAWVFGSLLKINKSYHILRDSDMYEDGHHVCQESDCPTWVELDTVGQYTGMTDKNGVKIFEGDIVHWKSPYGHSFTKAVGHDDAYGRFTPLDVFMGYDCEVIGNIHDNPELLSTK